MEEETKNGMEIDSAKANTDDTAVDNDCTNNDNELKPHEEDDPADSADEEEEGEDENDNKNEKNDDNQVAEIKDGEQEAKEEDNEKGTCPVCQKEGQFRCSGCQAVFYCSASHQHAHWKTHRMSCGSPIGISIDPKLGRQLVATRVFKKRATLIPKERPLVYFPVWRGVNNWVCLRCSKPEDKCDNNKDDEDDEESRKPNPLQRRCTICSWPICSERCEKYMMHKDNECAIFRKYKIQFPPNAADFDPRGVNGFLKSMYENEEKEGDESIFCSFIGLLRLLCVKKKHPVPFQLLIDYPPTYEREVAEETAKKDSEDFEAINAEIDAKVALFCQIMVLAPEMRAFAEEMGLGDIQADAREFIAACKTILQPINIVMLDEKTKKPTMKFLYLFGNLMNHSCFPNSEYVISPKTFNLKVKLRVPIARGVPLTLNYTNDDLFCVLDRRARNNQLAKSFHFKCKCVRCLDPKEMGACSEGVTCRKCRRDGELIPDEEWNGKKKYSNIYEEMMDKPSHDDPEDNLGYYLPTDVENAYDKMAIWECNKCHSQKRFMGLETIVSPIEKELEGILKLKIDKDDEEQKKLLDKFEKKIKRRVHFMHGVFIRYGMHRYKDAKPEDYGQEDMKIPMPKQRKPRFF